MIYTMSKLESLYARQTICVLTIADTMVEIWTEK